MKKCKDIENDLPLYPDDLLSGPDKEAVEEHLKSCPQCSDALNQLMNAKKLVGNLADVNPPPWFKQNIMARVREESERQHFVRKWFYPLRIKVPVQIVATVCIAVIAVYVYRSGEERMKAVMPSSAPAPVAAIQGGRSSEQATETFVDADKPKAEKTEKQTLTSAADERKGVKSQVAADISSEINATAPAARSFEQPQADVQKKNEKDVRGVSGQALKASMAGSVTRTPDIRVQADDIDVTAAEIEELLLKVQAKNIFREMTRDKILIKAEMSGRNIEDFKTRLKKEILFEESDSIAANTEEYVSVLIEITKK